VGGTPVDEIGDSQGAAGGVVGARRCGAVYVWGAEQMISTMELPFDNPPWKDQPRPLTDYEISDAQTILKTNHYTHSVPSGKSYYVCHESAILVWSIPANCNLATFILGWPGNVWELSRLWAPDGHKPNLLTQTIKYGVRVLCALEPVDAVVSYADPNAGHEGGIYRAASWIYHGQSEETRCYRSKGGQIVARRAFHSGSGSGLQKSDIEQRGFIEDRLPGKYRFVRPISRRAKAALSARGAP